MDTKMGKKRKWSYFTFFWFVNEKQALPLSDDREWKAVKTSRIRSRRKENKKLSKFQKKTIYIWFVSQNVYVRKNKMNECLKTRYMIWDVWMRARAYQCECEEMDSRLEKNCCD